jgi:hypothetical protein
MSVRRDANRPPAGQRHLRRAVVTAFRAVLVSATLLLCWTSIRVRHHSITLEAERFRQLVFADGTTADADDRHIYVTFSRAACQVGVFYGARNDRGAIPRLGPTPAFRELGGNQWHITWNKKWVAPNERPLGGRTGFALQSEPFVQGNGSWSLTCPIWFLLIVCGSFPAWGLLRGIRFTCRTSPSVCNNCGYDLRATPNRCPECGEPAPAARPSPAPTESSA